MAATLLAWPASWALGWSTALHLAEDHHQESAPSNEHAVGLELALHGHSHSQGTPSHGHPLVTSVAAPLPGKVFAASLAAVGCGSGLVPTSDFAGRLLSPSGPTHDPPPRLPAFSVLRI